MDIIAMILFTANNGETKSSIMSKAHLNYRQIKKYIKILVINGLVIERNNLSEALPLTIQQTREEIIWKCTRNQKHTILLQTYMYLENNRIRTFFPFKNECI